MDFAFHNSFYDSMEGFYAPAEAAKPSAPKLLIFNHALAETLGLDASNAGDDQLARLFRAKRCPRVPIRSRSPTLGTSSGIFRRNSAMGVHCFWAKSSPPTGRGSTSS